MNYVKIYLLLLTILFSSALIGQNKGFYQDVDRNPIEVGETFQLSITLENIDASSISLGDISPFQIVGGPATTSSYSNINGKSSTSKSYKYILQATQRGNFTIQPATAQLGSKTLRSNALSIKVVESSTPKIQAASDKKSFIRLEPSSLEGYPGQLILLDYVLYTRQNIERYDISPYEYPDGFFVDFVKDFRDQPQRKNLNGQEYVRAILKKDRLYPQKVGNFDIGPMNINLEIPLENGRSSFFFTETRNESLKIPAVKLKIMPLPTPIPMSFSGGVGDFKMNSHLKKSSVVTGEAISLVIEVEGIGDPKTLKAPEQKWPEFLETYPPTVIKEEVVIRSGLPVVTKTFEYLAVCQIDTIFSLVPEMTYLDPNQKKYIILTGETVSISVIKGQPTNKDINEDVLFSPRLSHLQPLTSINDSFWTPQKYWFSVLSIAFLTILAIWVKKKRLERDILKKNIENSAQNKAHESLKKAYYYMENRESQSFFNELASATTGFIIKQWSIPHLEANPKNISVYLEDNGAPQEAIDLYKNIHQKAELARFASVYTDMEALYQDAERLLKLLVLPAFNNKYQNTDYSIKK